MAIARFVMVACSGEHLSVRGSLTCFEALKLNLLSVNLLMANLLTESGIRRCRRVLQVARTRKGKEVRRK